MVFKGRFFSSSSSKKSDSSSAEGSSSPRTPTFDSPGRSDKKHSKSDSSTSPSTRHPLLRRKKKQQQPKADKVAMGKETAPPPGNDPSVASATCSAPGKLSAGESNDEAFSPIVASSLGLNRIKTRSGPLLMERTGGAFAGSEADRLGSTSHGPSNFARGPPHGCCSTSSNSSSTAAVTRGTTAPGKSGGKKKGSGNLEMVPEASRWVEKSEANRVNEWIASSSVRVPTGQNNSSWTQSEGLRNLDACTPEAEPFDTFKMPKESESPRFKAIIQDTSVPRKRLPSDVKSFSHELDSKGVRPYPFLKPRGINNLKEILKVIHVKFEKAKEEVNSDLAIFAGELVGIMEKSVESHPEWKETLEDLLLLARSCVVTSPGDFWLQCEGIVQDLDDRRQDLPMGVLKKLHTRMLFILTRCTRLLQFHKESMSAEDEIVVDFREVIIGLSEKKNGSSMAVADQNKKIAKSLNESISARKSYSQEQHRIMSWRKSHEIMAVIQQPDMETTHTLSPPGRERIASWKPLPSPATKIQKESITQNESVNPKATSSNNTQEITKADINSTSLPDPSIKSKHSSATSKHQHKTSWGYWGDQQNLFDDSPTIMCRICEEFVPTSHVEDHLKVCTIADRCDQKGLSVDERLTRIAETLEKLIELCSQMYSQNSTGSPDIVNSSISEELDTLSPNLGEWSRRRLADMPDCFQEVDNPVFMDDLKGIPTMTCKTRFGPKPDQGMTTSSAGSMTPQSPLMTPRTNHIDSLLTGKGASEHEDLAQIKELADIARCIANTPIDDERYLPYLVSCVEDLQNVVDRRQLEALTVQTFGARIEILLREKYLHLCDTIDVEKVDARSTILEEEEDVVHSLRTSPIHPSCRDRTSIDDFEIIKPISRGAFGRVFLAQKRTTGDLFAIKVLKKADMIRKNAVENILAERDILITVRNPFVVRFFYSFTSRENLYLVMEYLNGGDLYSLLRTLGCLDEEVARIYMAEVVLALEYLHSLRVVHRDLKPDNLLIAHDGHIKLTDFGLSKVGLINSTDDLSGPAVSGTSLMGEDEPSLPLSEHERERRKKRSAVGTPDYLAPEILLGTGHGASADWWSVGVILFELVVGIPPFNAEHPQIIFDNILNRKIPWPLIPEEMSYEAHDLIDRLLTEDPNQRLGAKGAEEVKKHIFFKDINWNTLARQKAAFVPSSDSALDTSYFTSRYSWNPSDERINEVNEFENSSDNGSVSGDSSCVSNHQEEMGNMCDDFAEFGSGSDVGYSFSNFSFKRKEGLERDPRL